MIRIDGREISCMALLVFYVMLLCLVYLIALGIKWWLM